MDGGVTTESNLPKYKFEPKELKGIGAAMSQESIGGNAGPARLAVTGIYDPETDEYRFTNYESSNEIVFKILTPDLRIVMEALRNHRAVPPTLIEDVIDETAGPEAKERAIQRAIQHNLKQVLDYMSYGGEWNNLSLTPLLPSREDVYRIFERLNPNSTPKK